MRFHLSLKDPLMRVFAGEWVEGVLSRLGMEESKPIQSRMIARRIRVAQAQFARQVDADQPADSPEKWLRLNVPTMAS